MLNPVWTICQLEFAAVSLPKKARRVQRSGDIGDAAVSIRCRSPFEDSCGWRTTETIDSKARNSRSFRQLSRTLYVGDVAVSRFDEKLHHVERRIQHTIVARITGKSWFFA